MKQNKQNDKNKQGKKKMSNVQLIIMLVIAVLLWGACSHSSSDSDTKDESSKTEQKSSVASSSKKESYTAINKEISDTISENKKYAEDGNSSFSGYGYIDKVVYTGDRKLDVYVYNEFNSLSKDEKTNILNEIQGTAQMPLLDHEEITNDQYKEGLFITIKLGKNSVGCSKATNHREYHFYD